MKRGILALSAILSVVSTAPAETLTLNFAGSIASGHAAQATFTFDDSANTVRVRIANTMTGAYDAAGGRDLSALFWNFSNTGAFGVVYDRAPIPNGPNANTWNALNVAGSNGGTVNTNPYDVEQLWAFQSALAGAPGNAFYGLSSSGLGLFGPADMLQSGGPPPQPAGPDGTIVSPTGDPFDSSRPQFRSFVEFEFGVDHDFFPHDLSSIGVSSVRAQFNTSLNPDQQVGLVLVPAPPAAWAALGCVGVVFFGRRRMHTR